MIKTDPQSRRLVLSAWNVSDLDKMALPPCHIMYIFKVTDHDQPVKTLNCKLVSGPMICSWVLHLIF